MFISKFNHEDIKNHVAEETEAFTSDEEVRLSKADIVCKKQNASVTDFAPLDALNC